MSSIFTAPSRASSCPGTLTAAVDGIDAVVLTHGDNSNCEAGNYGAVRNVLRALEGRPVRITLMTTVGATVRHPGSEWKRRGERLVRASGNRYTIVRPGWFDYNVADQLQITMRQGDTHQAGSPADGVIARHQIARVLIDSLRTTVRITAPSNSSPTVAPSRTTLAPSSKRSTLTRQAHATASTMRRICRSTRNRSASSTTRTTAAPAAAPRESSADADVRASDERWPARRGRLCRLWDCPRRRSARGACREGRQRLLRADGCHRSEE